MDESKNQSMKILCWINITNGSNDLIETIKSTYNYVDSYLLFKKKECVFNNKIVEIELNKYKISYEWINDIDDVLAKSKYYEYFNEQIRRRINKIGWIISDTNILWLYEGDCLFNMINKKDNIYMFKYIENIVINDKENIYETKINNCFNAGCEWEPSNFLYYKWINKDGLNIKVTNVNTINNNNENNNDVEYIIKNTTNNKYIWINYFRKLLQNENDYYVLGRVDLALRRYNDSNKNYTECLEKQKLCYMDKYQVYYFSALNIFQILTNNDNTLIDTTRLNLLEKFINCCITATYFDDSRYDTLYLLGYYYYIKHDYLSSFYYLKQIYNKKTIVKNYYEYNTNIIKWMIDYYLFNIIRIVHRYDKEFELDLFNILINKLTNNLNTPIYLKSGIDITNYKKYLQIKHELNFNIDDVNKFAFIEFCDDLCLVSCYNLPNRNSLKVYIYNKQDLKNLCIDVKNQLFTNDDINILSINFINSDSLIFNDDTTIYKCYHNKLTTLYKTYSYKFNSLLYIRDVDSIFLHLTNSFLLKFFNIIPNHNTINVDVNSMYCNSNILLVNYVKFPRDLKILGNGFFYNLLNVYLFLLFDTSLNGFRYLSISLSCDIIKYSELLKISSDYPNLYKNSMFINYIKKENKLELYSTGESKIFSIDTTQLSSLIWFDFCQTLGSHTDLI